MVSEEGRILVARVCELVAILLSYSLGEPLRTPDAAVLSNRGI